MTIAIALVATFLVAKPAAAAEAITLDEAIERALEVMPALANAAANSDFSRAKINEARAPLYPTISGAGQYTQMPGYDQKITNRGMTLAQLVSDYTIFDGGRRNDQVRAARYAAEAAMLGVAAVRAQIVFDTSVAYFDLQRTREQELSLDANLNRLASYVAIVEVLERSGRSIVNDVLRIRTARDAAQLALINTHQAVEHASIILASLIGAIDTANDLQIATLSDYPAPQTAEVKESPAYRAAERQVRSNQMLVTAARDERYPTVKVGLTAGWLGIDPPKTFGHHLGASYDTMLAIPIFQGGLIQSHIDQALAAQRMAEAQRRQIELQLARDLADANSRYANARKQLDLLAQSQETADDSFALDWTRFLGGGNVMILEVLDANQQAVNLRLARYDQEFATRQASAQAALILGIAR